MAEDNRAWDMLLSALDEFKKANTKEHEKIAGLVEAQNGRVKNLELWRARLIGIAFGASGLASVLVRLVWK